MSTDNTEALPPLPEPFMTEWSPRIYSAWADQMRDYARAALAQRQQAPADLLREACAQIKHLTDDLTTLEHDGPLVRYVPKANLMFSNLIGALLTLVPKMESALTAAPSAQAEPVKHRQGCDALGGYGNGIGPCTCGADQPSAQAEPTCVECGGPVMWRCHSCGIASSKAASIALIAAQAEPQEPLPDFEWAHQYATKRRLAVTRQWIRGWDDCIDYIEGILKAHGISKKEGSA